jgi:predicted DNA-binding protein YlxM (UPF0122 family)
MRQEKYTLLDGMQKRPLTVEIIAACLAKGMRQVDIARLFGVSRQAVHDLIRKRSEELEMLLDSNDSIIAMKAKLIATRAMGNINRLLDQRPRKKDLHALNAISGTHIEKYLLLSGGPTARVENVFSYSQFLERIRTYPASVKHIEVDDSSLTEKTREILEPLLEEGEK